VRCRTRNALVVLTAALAACTRLEPVRDCQPRGPARPVCGFQNPEDLVPLPDGRRLLVSEFGNIEGTRPGRIVLYDLATDARTVLYEGGAPAAAAERWGDPACPGPPSRAFAPHGIDLGRRPDGGLVLLAVDHGGREAIEFFDVTVDGAVAVTWRGCAMPPPGSLLNDVASLPDGGFVTTHMYERSTGTVGLGLAYLFGRRTGYVLEWQPGRGFRRLPGTDDGFPNGITVARDGASIYLDATMSNTVRRIERASGRELARAAVQAPDNVSWGDGRLLVASIRQLLRDREALLEEIERSQREPDAFGRFVVEVEQDGHWARAGAMGFELVNRRSRIANLGNLAIHPDFRGRRLSDEAAKLLQRYLLFELDLHRLQLEIYGFNERAQRHAERAGFVHEGARRRAYWRHGEWVDGVIYGLVREDLEP